MINEAQNKSTFQTLNNKSKMESSYEQVAYVPAERKFTAFSVQGICLFTSLRKKKTF